MATEFSGLANRTRSTASLLPSLNEITDLLRLSSKNQGPGGYMVVTKFEKAPQGARPVRRMKQLHEDALAADRNIIITMLNTAPTPLWAQGMEIRTLND